MFARLFGKKEEPKPATRPAARNNNAPSTGGAGGAPRTGAAIQKIDETLETMDLRERKLQKQIDQETQKAKDALARKNKQQALLCMKRKKLYEDNLAKISAQRANMETLKITMEDSAMNADVLAAQRHAGSELERINHSMGAERVEEDMDRMRDAMEEQQRIAEMLGEPIGNDIVDDDDLMSELNAMVAEDKKATKVPAKKATTSPQAQQIDLPAVPQGEIKTKVDEEPVDDDEAELRRLEAELNGA